MSSGLRNGSEKPQGSPSPTKWMQAHANPPSEQSTSYFPGDVSRKPSVPLESPVSPPLNFGPLSSSPTDRVFPIKSAVSVDPTPTPSVRSEGHVADGFPGMVLPTDSSRLDVRQYSISSVPSARRSSDYVETTPRSRYDTDRQALGPQEAGSRNSVASGPMRRALSHLDGPHRDRIAGLQPNQRFASKTSEGGDNAPEVTASTAGSIRNLPEDTASLLTARSKHVMTEGGHAVITGRDGDILQRCEDEPIHIPGAVQSFGLLIALQEEDDNKLKVRVVSENSEQIIGYTPNQLFQLENFCDLLSEEQMYNLLEHVDFVRDDDSDPAINGPEVFTLVILSPKRKIQKLWCAIHINESNRDLIICEFELEDDRINPLRPAGDLTPAPPEDTLHGNPTAEEYAESTINLSKPLRVLRSARRRKGEAAAMEVFNIMSQVQEQLASAQNLDTFLKILVGVVKELTGFHRVMVYQFDQSWNGKVVTELVDTRATKDLYRGLHFPASDIPAQARDLYRVNKVRLLYDREQETARLVCRTIDDLETPLDLTFSYLRAMSPIHLKYLANMAVRASMSISINAFNELWGLIACHSYGSRGMRVSFPIRKMCRLVGESASRNIERLSYASRLQARKLINTIPTETHPSGYIVASSEDLLKLFDADFGLLSIRNETKVLGKLAQTQEALAMLEYLRLRKITSVTNSADIRIDFPDIIYAPGFTVIAGLLLVPLSVSGSDLIVFFRKGQTREVKWAGNPYHKSIREGTDGFLEPRGSFAVWSETVLGKCREWTEEQVETAAVLCLVYGKFIEVWRQKEAVLQNSELTRILLANSAHEVRTPLNAIINYLEIALEGTLDSEARENLIKSHSASKSLIYVINDLLDLTKTEEGHSLIKNEIFDLPATIRDAADMFAGDAKRKNIDYEVVEHPGVPQYVIGDQGRVRQAISNLTANAIQNTSGGVVKIEVWLAQHTETRVEIDIVIQDTGVGMSAEKLDSLFRDLEQVQSESDERLPKQVAASEHKVGEKTQGSKTLGLGLALVARIIRNMNGQLRLKSEEGKGSRFVIQFGFELPEINTSRSFPGPGLLKHRPSTPPIEKGEILLINKNAQNLGLESSRRRKSIESIESTDSIASLKSFKSDSSGKSDVDRLIDAIQEPHLAAKTYRNDAGHQRSRTGSRSEKRSERSRRSSKLSIPDSMAKTTTAQEYAVPGEASVEGSRTPIRPVKMPMESSQGSADLEFPTRTPARVLFDIPAENRSDLTAANDLRILVAEDDPINRKIVKKRLEKIGHSVCLTVNGEDCSSAFNERAAFFDVILMDMQMPIVDGITSTKMIRSFEKTHPGIGLSDRVALNNGRVPIFAVSASLIEKDRQLYIDAGFDGWILKPIDFKRLSILFLGIFEEQTREWCLYEPGEWEKGGWFTPHQPDVLSASSLNTELHNPN